MARYDFQISHAELMRNGILLDTNVLVAAFLPRSSEHETARLFINEWEDQLIVPITVVVETWGMIVGSHKYWNGGIELLLWLTTPGNAILISDEIGNSSNAFSLIQSIRVDSVDALLAYLGDSISRQCTFRPHIRIATFDTDDFLRCRAKDKLQFTIFDLHSFEEY